MEVMTGYKLTEVGVIPENWDVRMLGTLGKRGRPAIKAGPFGSALTKDTYVSNGYKVYGQEQVIRGDLLFGDYFISKGKFNDLKNCAVEAGDILLSLVGTTGRVLVIPVGSPPGIINPRLLRFSFDRDLICPQFFKSLFESDHYQALLSRSAQGGTMGVLNAGLLRPLYIPCPPLPEQEAIAEALSDADALIESLEQLIAKKRNVKQGTMRELLCRKERWKDTSIGVIADQIVGGGTPSRGAPNYWNGDIPWMTVKDFAKHNPSATTEYITREGLKNSASHLVPKRTIITSTRMALGKAVIYDVDVAINQDLKAIFTNKEIDTVFLFYWFQFNERYIAELGSGSTVMGISLNDLRKIPFAQPSLSEQLSIATILSDMDAEIAALEAKLDKARKLKQGMMHELLTGRIRLV